MASRIHYYLSSIPTLLSGIENWPQIVSMLWDSRPTMVKFKDGTRFKVRTLMDIWILKETCFDKDYERASVDIQDHWVVIDIGAGLGDFAISVAKSNPQSTVYAYEPFPESFALLRQNIRLNNVANVHPYPYAISDCDGNITLDVTSSAEAVHHSTATSHNGGGVPVESLTLDSVFRQSGLQYCDFLKADCEGAEFGIFLSSNPNTLARIKHICLEYHDGMTPNSHRDLAQFFISHGLEVSIQRNPVHTNLGLMHVCNRSLNNR